MDERPRLPVGVPVEVHSTFADTWSGGFEVAAVVDGGYQVRRVSDGMLLPSPTSLGDLRPAPR